MAIKDVFRDISAFVISVGYFEKIKVTATKQEISLEALDKDKTVILKGEFPEAISDLTGEFGISNLSLLQTITNDPEYAFKESTMDVVYETKAGESNPAELHYVNKSKSNIKYRFMYKNHVPEQPKFMEPKWDVVITPSKSNIQQLAWVAGALSSYEQYFTPKIVDNELKFFIGEDDAASQRGGIVISTDRTETFDSVHKWKVSLVLAALKAGENCDCEMAFSTKGAIQITLNTGIGKYRYIFPSKAK